MNRYKVKHLFTDGKVSYAYPGDIVIINENQVYNTTKGLDFIVDDPEFFKETYLQIINDEIIPIVTTTYQSRELSETEKQINQIKTILDSMLQTYIKKNHDYGNSFDKSLDEEGLASVRIRIGDKWNRFKQLSKGENVLVKDESIKDTLLDMALYAVMTVNWLNNGK